MTDTNNTQKTPQGVSGEATRRECPYCHELKELCEWGAGKPICFECWMDFADLKAKEAYDCRCSSCGQDFRSDNPHEWLCAECLDIMRSEAQAAREDRELRTPPHDIQ
jgi:hypothetical protein